MKRMDSANADARVEIRQTRLGPLKLEWKKGRLSALRLPLSPPSGSLPPFSRKGEKDWGEILGLKYVRLDDSGRGPFFKRTWQVVRKIPFGEARSYAWVARMAGRPKGARAVGRAMKTNPWPLIVPCHRVVRSDGSLGGFRAGLKWKKYLLSLEKKFPNP